MSEQKPGWEIEFARQTEQAEAGAVTQARMTGIFYSTLVNEFKFSKQEARALTEVWLRGILSARGNNE